VALVAGAAFPALAADKTVTIGINLPLTGADAHDAELIKDGALLALDEANAQGGVAGYKINVLVLDDGTATAGQYDPAQAATKRPQDGRRQQRRRRNRAADERLGQSHVADLSQGNLPIITPASTNPDITDPKFAGQYRPAGKAIYFRTVDDGRLPGPQYGQLLYRHA